MNKIVRYQHPRFATPSLFFGGRGALPAFERDLDRLFNAAFSDLMALTPGFETGGVWSRFAVDLYEDDDNHYVRAELPGLDRKHVNVEMAEGYLNISGSRKVFAPDGKEEESVEFSRSIAIPEAVQADKVTAAYEDGILTVTLPKRAEAKPRRITVEVK